MGGSRTLTIKYLLLEFVQLTLSRVGGNGIRCLKPTGDSTSRVSLCQEFLSKVSAQGQIYKHKLKYFGREWRRRGINDGAATDIVLIRLNNVWEFSHSIWVSFGSAFWQLPCALASHTWNGFCWHGYSFSHNYDYFASLTKPQEVYFGF